MRTMTWMAMAWGLATLAWGQEAEFSNSLGMQFIPSGSGALLGKYEVQIRDYQIFITATKRPWPKPDFKQESSHPAVNVSWEDAKAFAYWLTQKEIQEGILAEGSRYRLPTDDEWSEAAGLRGNNSSLNTSESEFPWGADWPPPPQAGNYSPELAVDSFPYTAPCGSFPANAKGFFDLGGNAWEWCEDAFNQSVDYRVLRGASWRMRSPGDLLTNARIGNRPDLRLPAYGFRLALEKPKPWDARPPAKKQ